MSLVAWLTTLADLVRLRILRLLDREELSVGELARVLQLPQSTVSRHLKVLHDGQWIHKRSEGTASYYRLRPEQLEPAAAQLWQVAHGNLDDSPTLIEDDHRLAEVLAERSTDSRTFFGRVVGEWDHLRGDLFGTMFTAEALLGLIPSDLVIADLGCGTGNASELIAPFVHQVIAVDREPAMLEAARKRLHGVDNIDFRTGDMLQLPIEDDHIDVAVCILVIHHIQDPMKALEEMARIVRPGGRLLIVDMVSHDRETYRYKMGHSHLGFGEADVRGWADRLGAPKVSYRRLRPAVDSAGPGLFAATMTVA